MTTPGQNAPDGAYAIGSRYGQDRTEENIRSQIKAPPINAWQYAQDVIKEWCMVERKSLADHKDGQHNIRDRMDLLNQNDGYGCAFMGFNWGVGHSQWVVLPFDEQLGPMKHVQVTEPIPGESGFLTLKAGGLWRIDTHICVTGYNIEYVYTGNALFPYNYPLEPTLMLEVVSASGSLITAMQYDMVTDLTESDSVLYGTQINAPRSAAFSKTFVLPDMPPEDDPLAADHWVHVRLSLRYSPVGPEGYRESNCKVLGGTKLSSLIATRWSKDVANVVVADVVPDGGDLG